MKGPAMSVPVRLQLSRKRGFSLAAISHRLNNLDAVVVARPSKWGNPFGLDQYGRQEAVKLYRRHIQGKLASGDLNLSDLRGKNLACWCAPEVACHADVLLELANRR